MADINVEDIPDYDDVETGTVTTDAQGKAKRLISVNTYMFNALTGEFEGDNQYKPCKTTIRRS